MASSRDLAILKTASILLRGAPIGVSTSLAQRLGERIAGRLGETATLRRNLLTAGVDDPDLAAKRGIGAYAKYWVDTLRLPTLSSEAIDRRFSFLDYHHILDVLAAGKTPIMVLPHLGSWEWAAAWLGRLDHKRVVAVVERLEPEEAFEWFRTTRQSYGVEVVPLGSDAMKTLMSTAGQSDSIICLVADRDIAGNGIPVDLFGRTTSMPAGPALLSLRTGCPLLPVAIYDRGSTRECHVGEPLWPERQGKLRADVSRITQTVAGRLESLISAAPEQWHVLSDMWPEEQQ